MVTITKLLATKLYIPRARPALVERPRLLERLHQGMQGRLTLISALPGSGKTTLLSEWQASEAGKRYRLAWVSLDESDNDPTRFWSYVIKALETLYPGIGEDALALLHAFPAPPIESVLTTLINAITAATEAEDLALVIDDYHFIVAEPIHDAFAFLLDHLPSQMHIVLITRVDPPLPLARLRVRGQLTEVRTADLRFTPTEAMAFLNKTMELQLSLEDATRLTSRTEGWIAGLQLAALSMQGQEQPTDSIPTFSGSHRHVLDYLAQEVLARQPAHVQSFLQQTSILQRLSAELCETVTGRTDSQELLQRLDASNMFLISLDQERHWYRYHALFGEFLLNALRKTHASDVISTLHHRAAQWYEQHGLMNDAVHHLLASADFEQAAELIEHTARSVWMRGESLTLQCWIEALPKELMRSRPRLGLFHTWSLISSNRLDEAEQVLADVERVLHDSASPHSTEVPVDLHAEILILHATLARFRNDIASTIEYSRQALDYLSESNLLLQSINTLNLGHAYRLRGNVAAASEAFTRSIVLGREVGNVYTILLARNNLIQLHIEQGTLRLAAEQCKETLQFAARHGCQHLPLLCDTYTKEGELFYEWNDLLAARQRVERGIQLGLHDNNTRFLLQGYMAQARICHAQGEETRAHEILEHAAELARSSLLGRQIAALRARLWLAEGHLSPAFAWLQNSKLHANDVPDYPREFEYLVLARLLIAQGKAKETVPLLEHLRQAAQAGGRSGNVISILLLQSLANAAQHHDIQAFTALEGALTLAEPEGYIRLFVDEGPAVKQLLANYLDWQERQPSAAKHTRTYVRQLCTVLASQTSTGTLPHLSHNGAAPLHTTLSLMEPLGEREVEVLRYLAAGLSNQTIAEEMVIALSTVKSHLKSIYRKLDVESRTQAVARARDLQIL